MNALKKLKRHSRLHLSTIMLMIFAAAACIAAAGSGSAEQRQESPDSPGMIENRRGAWLDEIVFVQQPDPGQMVNQIERGAIDLYASGITNPVIHRRILESPRVQHTISYGASVELTMNTAEFSDPQQFNPFHCREIRQAMNRLLDRDYIADEVFGGLASPRYLPISTVFPDYARLAPEARTLELRYAHDRLRAEETISSRMRELGAEKRQDSWFYKGEPVELKLLIRTEDARQQLGDYVGNVMEELGFRVNRMYRTAEEASRIWIASDPAGGGWHLYTGSWISIIINRDQAGELDQFYTPRGRPEPLWQAYTPEKELDEVAEALRRRAYDTWEERQDMMARGMELAMRESTRVWLVDQQSAWAYAGNVEFAADLAGGFSGSALWPYTLRFTDRQGGRMTIGVPSLLTEPWNPVAGTNWIFDRMITRSLHDPVVLPDPFTGLFRPQRIQKAEVTVREDIPVQKTLDWAELKRKEKIQVPEDTWIEWDSDKERFITIGEKFPDGVEARTRTRVVFEEKFKQRLWHDGSSASLADIILPWIMLFERADENSPLFDRSAVPIFQSFTAHFRGWRIISEEPLEIEIYSDQIFPDVEWIAGNRAPGASAWHLLVLGILAEREGTLAFSSDKADQLGAEWMNLVSGPSLPVLDRHLQRAKAQNYIPYEGKLGQYIDKEEAAQRYQNLARWRRERRHYWVGNGPFYLHSARPVENIVVLRRFEDFPDSSDKWLGFDTPRIPEPRLRGPNFVKQGEAAEFSLTIKEEQRPYPANELAAIDFLVFDSADELKIKDEARPREGKNGEWLFTLSGEQTAELATGAARMEVAINSRLVALPSFASFVFAVLPSEDK